ncbi:MAG: sensor domain-containing diguanylate cyclase [Magnetococcus sp. YQC-3]
MDMRYKEEHSSIKRVEERLGRIEDTLHAMIGVSLQEALENKQVHFQQEKLINYLETELKKSRGIANALTSCNEALVRSTTEEQFLEQVCELIVKSGEYQFVWIGFASNDEAKTIRPVAQYGFEYGYLEKLNLTWEDSNERGHGPSGRAIRSLTPETANDIANDPQFKYWRSEALKRGYASSISLPFVVYEGKEVAVLNIYSKEAFAFNAEEITLLFGMAKDVSHGISSIRKNNKNQSLEKKNQLEYRSRIVISSLLETALKPITLERMLEACLDLILSIPWVSIMSKGSIFLFDNDKNVLTMVTQRNLSAPLLNLCQNIEIGYCLCGRAAKERKIVFSSCLDERHDVRFDGISEHGHYCMPIMADDALLGVLNLYVAHNHENDKDQELFLSTVANTLAGIIKRKSSEEKIHMLANTDSLTNIHNRRSFMEQLDREVARSKREKLFFSVLYIDLDKFKQVNDVFGHKAGDMLLVQVVDRMTSVLRESDSIARIGGDEFAIILPNSQYAGAKFVADKIINLLNEIFTVEGNEVCVGVSIGCSVYPEHGITGDALLQKADKALYMVKSRGKNHVLLYDDEFDN